MIDRITAGREPGPAVLVGPGDDAAVVAMPDARVVVTTDMLVQGRHFRTDWSTPQQIGGKAIAQNGADIAAMGAPAGLRRRARLPAGHTARDARRAERGDAAGGDA